MTAFGLKKNGEEKFASFHPMGQSPFNIIIVSAILIFLNLVLYRPYGWPDRHGRRRPLPLLSSICTCDRRTYHARRRNPIGRGQTRAGGKAVIWNIYLSTLYSGPRLPPRCKILLSMFILYSMPLHWCDILALKLLIRRATISKFKLVLFYYI